MRRWFEFGFNGDYTHPQWQFTSNTSKRRSEHQGDYPPLFISMPYKEQLFEILQGVSPNNVADFTDFMARITNGGSTDSPATDCTAEHVVNGANTLGWRVNQFYLGGIWQMLLGGFPILGGSGFTPNILQQTLEPPSKNG